MIVFENRTEGSRFDPQEASWFRRAGCFFASILVIAVTSAAAADELLLDAPPMSGVALATVAQEEEDAPTESRNGPAAGIDTKNLKTFSCSKP